MSAPLLPIKVNRGDGPALVLLHGLGNNHKSWTFVLRHLNYKKSQVIALDLLGFGDAPKPKDCQYTPADHAQAVIATLDSLNVTNAVIAGHSMGCIVAIEIAKQRPDLVKKLVLLGAPLFKTKPKQRTGLKKLLVPENGYFKIFTFLKENPDFTITTAKAADAALPILKGMQITDKTWPAFTKSLENTIMQFKTFKDTLNLSVPTVLVCGILDFFVIRANLKELARSNSKYITFRTALGPHEITPFEGRRVAKRLQK